MLQSGRHSTCAACERPFTIYDEIELGHIESKGIGGGKHNDVKSNLCLEHRNCNREQGSMSLEAYRALKGWNEAGH
jgi:hypothetical protein